MHLARRQRNPLTLIFPGLIENGPLVASALDAYLYASPYFHRGGVSNPIVSHAEPLVAYIIYNDISKNVIASENITWQLQKLQRRRSVRFVKLHSYPHGSVVRIVVGT